MEKILAVLVVSIMLTGISSAQNTSPEELGAPPLLQPNSTQLPLQPAPEPEAVAPDQALLPEPTNGLPVPLPGPATEQTISTRALLAGLSRATVTAQKVRKMLQPGRVWVMRAPGGEVQIKAGLVYQGAVVGILHFSPDDGNLLPIGIDLRTSQSNVQIQRIRDNLPAIIDRLQVFPAAEYTAPEACWSFPIVAGNIIVAHLKIYYDGIHVVQDYAAGQEMRLYCQ